MLIMEPPTLVDWAYTALKPFMDPVTVRKNRLVKAREVIEVVYAIASSAAQAEWLVAALTMEPTPGNMPPALPPGAPQPVHRTLASGVTSPMTLSPTMPPATSPSTAPATMSPLPSASVPLSPLALGPGGGGC